MPAIYTTIDQSVRELQDMTKAFLTDKYDNGDYVATPDDIAELQAATAAFLADRTDDEYCYMDGPKHGLLLPGEQFLLPISTAVGRAWSEHDTVREVIDLIDDCLDAQVIFEDVPDTHLLDGAPDSSNYQNVVYTSFVDILGPDSLPKTPALDGRTSTLTISITPTPTPTAQMMLKLAPPMATAPDPEYPCVSLEDILKYPDEVDRLLGTCDDDDEHSIRPNIDVLDAMSDISDTAYDGPDAFCPARASYSAAFFDPTTETLVSYTSLDSLLEMDYRNSCGADSDRTSGMFTFYDNDSDTDSDGGGLDLTNGDPIADPFITGVNYSFLHVDTNLPVALEEDEPTPAVSDSSTHFANCRRSLNPLTQRRLDFPVDEKTLSATPTFTTADDTTQELRNEIAIFGDAELPFDRETANLFSDMFTHDLWNNDPDLTLTMPIEQHQPAELIGKFEQKRFETLTDVLHAIRSRSSANSSTFTDDFKRELHLLMGDLQNLVSTGHLENSVDRVVHHMVVIGVFDSLVI
ncbi:hypothetical protein G6514_007558 [Epicoccum nigrum]|nr:hypothetical protein G6514_007558 [Epicoccum nigrum]